VKSILKEIRQAFEENVSAVYKLTEFDEIIQTFCITALQRVDKFLEKRDLSNHPSCSVKRELQQIEKIRAHESLRPHYQVMLNQCVVLLVSYFSSAIEDLFREALNNKIKNKDLKKLEKEEIKVTVGQLVSDSDVVDLFLSKKNISFQDMQSIAKAFNDYLEFEPAKSKDVNNIILAQACRHALVHSGGIVKDKIIKQVSNATPREVKQNLALNQRLLFTTDEIRTIGTSMTNCLDNLIKGVSKKL